MFFLVNYQTSQQYSFLPMRNRSKHHCYSSGYSRVYTKCQMIQPPSQSIRGRHRRYHYTSQRNALRVLGSRTHFITSNSAQTSAPQEAVFPPPVSVRKLFMHCQYRGNISALAQASYAWRLLSRNHVARLFRLDCPFVVHSAWVPLKSESRY